MGKRPKRMSVREQAAVAQAPEEIPYSFQSPESSTIVSAVYDPDTETLLVTFRHDDSTYRYDKCPLILWRDFLESQSKGKFFAGAIRPMLAGKKV